MGISIKTEETEKMARRLAELTGESLTEAVSQSIRERLERVEEAHCQSRKSGSPAERLKASMAEIRKKYEPEPVSKQDMDRLWGEAE